MKTIVVYQSNTGFTQQYAEWIANALGAECYALKEVSAPLPAADNTVIFGGWIMGNTLSGLEKFRKLCPQPAAVFAVGATPTAATPIDTIRTQNKLGELPLFYMEGGFRLEKLGFVQRKMLNMAKKGSAKQTEQNAQSRFMAEMLGTSFDHSDKAFIEPLVQFIAQNSR